MSDGDAPWLDEAGTQTSERRRDHTIAPGQSLLLELRGEIALTVLPEGAGATSEFFRPLLRVFRGDESNARDEPAQATAIDFSLATESVTRAVEVRVFASAAFPFSPLREFSLAPGASAQLSTGEKGITLRVA